jgi:hypothetical protein
MDIGQRAGVDFIGYYSCTDRVRRALKQLSRTVAEPAVDWELWRALKPLYPELDPRKDNRSVTDPEWVEKGLAKYGCPLHGTRDGNGLSGPYGGASGNGWCSCGTRAKREREVRESRTGIPAPRGVHSRGAEASYRGAPVHAGSIGLDGRDSLPVAKDSLGSGRGVDGGRFEPETYRHALRAAYSVATRKARRRRPLSLSEVVENHVHMDHYAGAPYFCRNRDALERAVSHAVQIAGAEREFFPYVAGRRVQHGNAGPKTRLVWMAPLSTTLLATRFSKVIHRELARVRPFSWGLDNQEKGAFVSELQSRHRFTFSLDFSQFDASLSAKLIRDAFNILRAFLDLNEEDEDLWNRLIHDFIHTKLVNHDRKMYRVHKGVPSGSAFTSQIDSVCNLIILNYINIRATNKGVDEDNVLILGDDALLATNVRIPLTDVSRYAAEIGVIVSPEKSRVVDSHRMDRDLESHVEFLGHFWVNSEPRRRHADIVRRMVFPERHSKRTKTLSWIRFISYGADAVEWWDIANAVVPASSPVQVIWRILARMDDDQTVVDPRDLTGSVRYAVVVEGRSNPWEGGKKGMKLPLTQRVA